MLSLSKHLYRQSKSYTMAVEMLRQAQHDCSFYSLPIPQQHKRPDYQSGRLG
jgi:hypothetical protein